MRTHNELERLAAAGQPLLSDLEAIVGADEEEGILRRILASPRPAARRSSRQRPTLVLGVAAVLAVSAVAAGIAIRHGNRPATATGGHRRVALSGAKIQLAGYHFRTPAGFKRSAISCLAPPDPSRPRPALDGFAAAASADGGCLEAAYLIRRQSLEGSKDAQPVDVGRYPGYFVPHAQGDSSQSSLFLDLPKAGGDRYTVSLLLVSQGLTEGQLIAVAESGLPTLPPTGPTMTTGTETNG